MATTVPVTGLSQLGEQLLRGSGDYANIQLRRQQEERDRAQRLADLQDARAYQSGREEAAVSRQQQLALWQARQARIQDLIAKGFLAQADAANEQAVAAADAAERGRTVSLRQQGDDARKAMQDSADTIGSQINSLYDDATKVQMRLNSIPTAPASPNPAQVEQAAVQLAIQAGADPKKDEVRAQYRVVAEKALRDAAMQEFFIAQEAADALKVSLQGYNTQIAALTRRLEGYERNGIVPMVKAPPAAMLQQDFSQAPAMRRVTPEEAAAAAGATPALKPATPVAAQQGYGGLMGAASEIPTALAALSNPAGAIEIGARTLVTPAAKLLNYVAGGERRVAEGDVERERGMQSAIQRFQQPSAPIPANPFFTGDVMSPGRVLAPLPPMPSVKRPPQLSPAFQFANSFAPGR